MGWASKGWAQSCKTSEGWGGEGGKGGAGGRGGWGWFGHQRDGLEAAGHQRDGVGWDERGVGEEGGGFGVGLGTGERISWEGVAGRGKEQVRAKNFFPSWGDFRMDY